MPDRRADLVRALVKYTKDGTIRWRVNSSNDSAVAVFGKGRVIISGEEEQGRLDIFIRVYDADGNNAETFSDVDLKNITGVEWFPALNNLLIDARRSALGVDDLLGEIISELEGSIPF